VLEKYLHRSIYIDILKVIAIIAVITIHISASTVSVTNITFGNRWWMTNIFDSLSRWAVPIFVMCSGATLLNKKESIKDFFLKRASKILVPFVLWSVFYYCWEFDFNHIKITGFVKDFLQDNVYIHLWYVYMIIGLYLVTPVFRLIAQNAKKSDIEYLLITWFVVLGVFPIINKLFNINISINMQIGWYTGYYFLGHYLHTYKVKRSFSYTAYILGLLAFATTLLGTYKLTIANKKITDYYFYNNNTAINILMTIAVFLLIKNIKWVNVFEKIKVLPTIVFNISNCSYGIYLGHFFIIKALYKYIHISYDSMNVFVGIPLLNLIILGISFIMVKGYSIVKGFLLEIIKRLKLKKLVTITE
jgi:surface polysaccharide O-acyltransferase-like enzyme